MESKSEILKMTNDDMPACVVFVLQTYNIAKTIDVVIIVKNNMMVYAS